MTEVIKVNESHELNPIRSWIREGKLLGPQMGPMFVGLLKLLTEQDFGECDQVVELTHDFLNALENRLQNHDLNASDSAKLFTIILTLTVEVGQYRHELALLGKSAGENDEPLPRMAALRERAITVSKAYFRHPCWSTIFPDIESEVFPLLESMGDASGRSSVLARGRYMPFRVIQAGNIVERLYGYRFRTNDPHLLGDRKSLGLLREIFDRKYLRFGTSGVRGRWGLDFTEVRAKRVAQAICEFLKAAATPAYPGAEDLRGKRIVIGYDSRRNARTVAEWIAQVCLGNGFKVDLANRDTPTPALVYHLTDFLDSDEVAALINCTASHNPPEWQGIKFNPRQGYPASTNVTDFIAARANQLTILDQDAAAASDLAAAGAGGLLQGFDPIVHYTDWILKSGHGNQRIPLDPDRIRRHFAGGLAIVDEMHGASRGYLTRLLGDIGVRHRIIHAERNPDIPGLDYANPEEPFIGALKSEVAATPDAILGLGMDTDADRFGVVDGDGTYYRPNQVLPMLVRYLGVDRGLTGRVIATQTGSPLLESLAAKIQGNDQAKPEEGVIPPYIDHPFYLRRIGRCEDRLFHSTFMVAVGIKYIEEQRRTDRHYRMLRPLPANWRDTILIGGEESSGLTTRGHVTDKDGIWANLLIMDMVAFYGKSLREIWQDTMACGGQSFFGGRELNDPPSNSGRADVDAVLEAKEGLINHYLDRYVAGEGEFAGLRVIYAGGTRYDFVELQLAENGGSDQHYLRVRASGTEPINRIYVESSDKTIAQTLMSVALDDLEKLSAAEIRRAKVDWRLVDILSATPCSAGLVRTVMDALDTNGWSLAALIDKLTIGRHALETRNQRVVDTWISELT